MNQQMTEGMELDPTTLITVQNERIASAAIREAQLTAAVQQLTMQKMILENKLKDLEDGAFGGKEADESSSDH